MSHFPLTPLTEGSTCGSALQLLVKMKVIEGKLTDGIFRDRRCYIIYSVNAVSTEPSGIARDLKTIYPYENTHAARKRLYSLHRATADTRDDPGRIIIHAPPTGSVNLPHLVACVTQYGWGEAVEGNEKARQAIATSKDLPYVEGLKMDTSVNRRQHFQNCLKKIALLAMANAEVEQIIIPEGLGCRGRCQDEWRNNYLPMVEGLAQRLQPFGVETILVRKSE